MSGSAPVAPRRRGLAAALRHVPRAAWLLVLLALVVRLGFIAATPSYTPIHDDRDYDRLACALANGGGYPAVGPRPRPTESSCGEPVADPRPTAYRPPAYPFSLGAVYVVAEPLHLDRRLTARVLQALVGTLAAALTGLVAWLVWGRRTGLVALGLAAVCPPLVVVGGSLITEPTFLTLMLGAVAAALMHRRSPEGFRWIGAAGVLVGLASLTRSNGFLLLLPLGAAVWTERPRLSRHAIAQPAMLVGIAALTIAPWTIRNAIAVDSFVPVTTEAGATFAGTYNDQAREDPARPGVWRVPRYVPELRAALADHPSEPVAQRRLLDRSLDYMVDHPGYVLEVMGRDTLRLANLDGADWWRFSARTISTTNAAGDFAAYGFFALAALAAVGIASGAARRAPPWLWAIPVLFLVSVVVVVGELRFRAPIDPFLVLLAALGVTWLWERLRSAHEPT